MSTIKFNNKNVKTIAHMGLSGIETENTCAAYIAAGNLSYYGIETDIHRTKDGYYVAHHDDNVIRWSGTDLEIKDTAYDRLKELVLKDRDGTKFRNDLRIPRVEEYISICKNYGKIAVLELKNSYRFEHIKELTDIIKDMGYLENVVFISFDFNNLLFIRDLYPSQQAQFITDDVPEKFIDLLERNKIDIDVDYKRLNRGNISLLKKAGIKINCWTCDNKEDAEFLSSCGIDYITSNILE